MNRKTKPDIIVITGAESTGKSELTQQLARHFGAPFVAEYAREYVEKLHRPYNYADVEHIAQMQHAQMQCAATLNCRFVFFDTWLVITKVWFEVAFGHIPAWINTAIRDTPIRLFLACDTDIPWAPQPVRENGGEMRLMLAEKYHREIKRLGFDYKIVSGTGERRLQNALKNINLL